MKNIITLAMLVALAGCTTVPKGTPSVALEFRTGSHSPGPGLTKMTAIGMETPVYISESAVLSNADVKTARAKTGPHGPQIEIVFTKEGSVRFADVTASNIRKPLGILVDGQLISAPVIMDKIAGGKAVITGTFSEEEAELIATGIRGR